MSDRISLLKLREQCVGTIALIDKMLGELPEPLAPDSCCQPFVVEGRCATITAHALQRYRERTGTTKGEVSVLNRIRERMEKAEEIRLKEKFRLIELLAHGRIARFFRQADMVFVVEDGMLITTHNGTADRWEPMPAPERPDMGNPISETGGPTA